MRTTRLLATGLLPAVLAFAPGTALADDDDDRRGPRWLHRHRHDDRHDERDRHERDRHERDRHERRPVIVYHGDHCDRDHGYGYSRVRHSWPAPYRCGPCGSHFRDRHAFHQHVHRHHHVPSWAVPHVVIHVGFGWVFHG